MRWHIPTIFRGGATLIFDLQEAASTDFNGTLRYVIRKRISDDTRLRHRAIFSGNAGSAGSAVFFVRPDAYGEHREPFAFVHRGG